MGTGAAEEGAPGAGKGTNVPLRETDRSLRHAELELHKAAYDLAQRRIGMPVAGWIGGLAADTGARIDPKIEITRFRRRPSVKPCRAGIRRLIPQPAQKTAPLCQRPLDAGVLWHILRNGQCGAGDAAG
jgi:hypothetical protein